IFIRSLAKVIDNGHLHKGVKPVHWCTDCGSALAEAEVEYEDKTSPAIDVAFAAVDKTKVLAAFGVTEYQAPVSMVIWTTTPWTLPANRALSLSPDLDYVLVEIESEDGAKQAVILAEALVESCITRYGVKSHQILGRAKGAELELMQFQHPFYDFSVPAILGDHVTTESGTGVVHTAPGHGQDDFVVGQKYGLEVANP
ncbi:class I tRNA ligase family protein, partial [Vibrio cholerae]|uniref:class I tRNA ligase family protein n=1 Tax=Vibrio cholerae TaxID=666 RepID=UPI00115FF250